MTEVRNRNPTFAIKALLLKFLDKYSYKDLYSDHCLNALVKGALSLLLCSRKHPLKFRSRRKVFPGEGRL